MKTKRLGCLSGTGLLATLITLLAITGIGLVRGGALFSPGDLNDQKAAVAIGGVLSHAETGGQCSACHPAFWSGEVMADRCLDCHSDIIQKTQDFHGVMMAEGKITACTQCHTDHNGAEASLTFLNLADFPHNQAGYSLQAHQAMPDGTPFACSDCHTTGFVTFDQTVCESCHSELDVSFTQSHQADFGTDCLACHDGLETYGQAFDHDQTRFALQGRHADVACTDCHAGARSLSDLQTISQDCYACHAGDDLHNGQLGPDCAQCHTMQTWADASFDHSLAAFQLTGAHASVECSQCHLVGPAGAVFKGTPQDCFACHEKDDAHDGRLGQDCGQCHTTQTWADASFDHSLAAFQLTGAHASMECSQCHLAGPAGTIFKGTPQDCFACHEQDDAHDGRFGQDCAQCHTTQTWAGASFDHSLAAFPLTGAHANVDCAQCHINEVFKGTSQECASCHADPDYHQGLFSSDCAACHTTDGWAPAQFDQAHLFPINHGANGWSDCQVCHPDRLQAYTCYGCHEHNPAKIESEHREEGISDFRNCVRCHPTGREEEGGEHEGGDD